MPTWAAPAQPPKSGLQLTLTAPRMDAETLADLHRRVEALPITRALVARGAELPPWPDLPAVDNHLAQMGQLDLTKVPALRAGMRGMGVMFLLALVLFAIQRWAYFQTPWGLLVGAALMFAAVLFGLMGLAKLPEDVAASQPLQAQARGTAGLLAVITGGLAAYVLMQGLAAVSGAWQTPKMQVFVRDKSTIDPGPVRLHPEPSGEHGHGAMPVMIWDSKVSYWRSQPDGRRYEVSVVRTSVGPWWVFDQAVFNEAMRAHYRQ